jgi:glycosyltransferase involved in cell wall biosynthesis
VSITVSIHSHGYGHLAAQCIDSVLTQTRKPDVVRFFDDGVGDCAHLPALYPEVDFVFRPQNLGTVASFQDALERVDTEFSLFIGADNWLRLDTLELLYASRSADIVSYDIYVVGEHREAFSARVGAQERRAGLNVWRFDTSLDMAATNTVHGSSMYRTALAKRFGYQARPGGARTEEDWHLFRRMMADGAKRVHLAQPLLFYRRHSRNCNPPA